MNKFLQEEMYDVIGMQESEPGAPMWYAGFRRRLHSLEIFGMWVFIETTYKKCFREWIGTYFFFLFNN